MLTKAPTQKTDVDFILTKSPNNSEEDLLKKTLFRERFSQAGQFWENKALLAAQTEKTHRLQEKLRQERILFLNTKQEKTSINTDLAAEKNRLIAENSTLHAYGTFWHKHALRLTEANRTLGESLSQVLSHLHQNAESWAAFSQDVMSRAEGLNALRNFLSTPAGFLRSLARTMVRGSMAPFVPDQPEPPALANALIADSGKPLPQTLANNTLLSPPATLHSPRRKVLFVAGEPESPGVQYRCIRNAAACVRAGHEARWKPCADVTPDDLSWADTVILWRVEFSGHVDILLQLARENGADIIFDTDDITFLPHLARFDIIDGIRSIGATEQRIETVFTEMRRTMIRSDLCLAPTDTLAGLMRINKPLTYTVPNTFDADSLRRSRMAMRKKHWVGSDGLVRIGYATGSRTHQRDFARVAGILAKLMLEQFHFNPAHIQRL